MVQRMVKITFLWPKIFGWKMTSGIGQTGPAPKIKFGSPAVVRSVKSTNSVQENLNDVAIVTRYANFVESTSHNVDL